MRVVCQLGAPGWDVKWNDLERLRHFIGQSHMDGFFAEATRQLGFVPLVWPGAVCEEAKGLR